MNFFYNNFCMLSLFKSLQGMNAQTLKTVYGNTNTIVICESHLHYKSSVRVIIHELLCIK